MTFVSYSQNLEDVMLWRALKHVEHGFYIDVGAFSDIFDSVTRAFYERGWRGINIEPNSDLCRQFDESRQRDINLDVAIGSEECISKMHVFSNMGLSTLDESIANRHVESRSNSGHFAVDVELTTLAIVWERYIPENQEVHFCKVDVEGWEKEVLLGNNWRENRPWIVVIEAMAPMEQLEVHEEWEHILVDAGYIFAYADGLNRFYVADDHSHLLQAFRYPPNFFDYYVASQQKVAEARADIAEARADIAEARADIAEVRANNAYAKAQSTVAQLEDVYGSTSWRITAPVRKLGHALKSRADSGAVKYIKFPHSERYSAMILFNKIRSELNRKFILIIRHARLYIRARPKLKNAFDAGMPCFSKTWSRLIYMISLEEGVSCRKVGDASELSPHAQRIYADLKEAIALREKKRS